MFGNSDQRNRRRATKRLKRDLIELQRANLSSIAAQPLDNDLFEWHVNIKPTEGAYCGVYLHLILEFPDSYPANPPNVTLCTPIEHPNVYGDSICLSMLRRETGNVPYEGWSGAYSATSILMQLQSFLFADNIDQDGGYTKNANTNTFSINRSIRICREFQCSECSHSHSKPFPIIQQSTVKEDVQRELVEESACAVDWHSDGVIDELWLWIFECLTASEVFGAGRVCRKWRNLMAKYNVAERHEMGCYFSKSKLTDNGCTEIMGIGLEIKPNESGFGVSVLSQMDILSKRAWRSGCRIGVWGEKLTHFLPMVMDRKHSERASDDIVQFLSIISNDIRRHTVIPNPNELEREMQRDTTLKLVDSLISMMNSIVVQFVMKNDEEMVSLRNRDYYSALSASKSIRMMFCEKVVIGYSAFHHLLLYLQSKNQELITSFADRSVALFMAKMESEGKSVCKDLGKLLIYTMISSRYQWADIAKLFIIELMTRNVKWMVNRWQFAEYNTTDFVPNRVETAFEAMVTSRRLTMFQIWFSRSNAAETLHAYNQRLGRPRSEVRRGILPKTKAILNGEKWDDFFNELGVYVVDNDIDQLLRFTVYNSWRKGYHRGSYSLQIVPQNAPKILMLQSELRQREDERQRLRDRLDAAERERDELREEVDALKAENAAMVMKQRVFDKERGVDPEDVDCTNNNNTITEKEHNEANEQQNAPELNTVSTVNPLSSILVSNAPSDTTNEPTSEASAVQCCDPSNAFEATECPPVVPAATRSVTPAIARTAPSGSSRDGLRQRNRSRDRSRRRSQRRHRLRDRSRRYHRSKDRVRRRNRSSDRVRRNHRSRETTRRYRSRDRESSRRRSRSRNRSARTRDRSPWRSNTRLRRN